MITPTAGSSRAAVKASDSSNRVAGRNALRTSGRLIVILAIPSAVAYSISVYSCAARCQSITQAPPGPRLICPVNLTLVTARPLHAVLLPAASGAGRLMDLLAAALDGTGPAIL